MRKLLSTTHALTTAMLIGAIAAFGIAAFSAFATQSEKFPDEILRLHILADSNSDDAQNFKYALRDHVLANFRQPFADVDSLENARAVALDTLPAIRESATAFARENGVESEIAVEITEMFFTTRNYGSFTLPAGTYSTLRITIGTGAGDNWWCIMFPSLCLPAVSETQAASAMSVPDESLEQTRPEIKFAIFEVFARRFT
jgi:stage II sporulation protein R